MPTSTTNYAFQLPAEGGDDDLWGGYLNSNWSALDALLLSMQQQIDNQKIKIGDLYLSTDATDPSTKLGYGTWEAYGAGRALIGVGNNGERDWTAGLEDGAEEHALTTDEMPTHDHEVDPPNTSLNINPVANHQHLLAAAGGGQLADGASSVLRGSADTGGSFNYSFRSSDAGYDRYLSSLAGGHTPSGTVNIAPFNTSSKGSNNAHNNVQPSIAVYVWKRLT